MKTVFSKAKASDKSALAYSNSIAKIIMVKVNRVGMNKVTIIFYFLQKTKF